MRVDLAELVVRESERVEWKENVADVNDVVRTLVAFANDLANLGGGHVVCGAAERKDENGFPKIELTGLTAARFKEIENKVLTRCRENVSPALAPTVEELAALQPERRVLVFTVVATGRAHVLRDETASRPRRPCARAASAHWSGPHGGGRRPSPDFSSSGGSR